MSDQQIKINVGGKVDPAVERDLKKQAAAAEDLAAGFQDVAKAAAAAGRAIAGANLSGLRKGLAASGVKADDALAALYNSGFANLAKEMPHLRRYGGLGNFLGGTGAAYRDQTTQGRAERDRVLRAIGALAPEGGGVGIGGIGSGMLGYAKRGLAFGGGLLGFQGIASTISRGFNSAMAENLSLDTAIRGSGALGSLEALRQVTEPLARQFGYLYTDTARFAGIWKQVTGGLSGVGGGLGAGLGMARAFGLDPNLTLGMLGAAHRTGADEGAQKRFALQIADAIGNSGLAGMSGEMIGLLKNFIDRTANAGLLSPNALRYAGDMSGLMSLGGGKLSAGGAAAILGSIDDNFRSGGRGPFGGAQLMQAIMAGTGLADPFLIRATEEGGIYASPAAVLGRGTPLGNLLRHHGVALGPLSSKATVDAVMEQFERNAPGMGGATGAFLQQLLGTSTQAAAAIFGNLWEGRGGHTTGRSMIDRLAKLGIPLAKVNESGMAEMSAILRAGDWNTLTGYGEKFLNGSQLSAEEKTKLKAALGGSDFGALQNVLFRDAAVHGQVEDTATNLRDMTASLRNIETSLGDHLADTVGNIYSYLSGADGLKRAAATIQKEQGDYVSPLQWWRGKRGAGLIPDKLDAYFATFGADAKLAKVLGFNEFSLNPFAQSTSSTAGGLFQFINGTWAQDGSGSKFNLANQRAAFIKERTAFFRGGGKTDAEFLMFHNYGPGHMHDAPTDLVKNELAQELHVHVSLVAGNKVLASKTVPMPKPGQSYAPAGAP